MYALFTGRRAYGGGGGGGVEGAVADPDLQIRGGGGHPVPEKKVGGGQFQKNFSALVWSKKKGGVCPDPSPGSATWGIL